MDKFIKHTGTGVPLRRSNVDTDQIIPAVYLKRVTRSGFEDGLFAAWRNDPDFVLNQEAFKKGTVLVAGADFGTGSSREHAVWALQAFGLRCVIGHRPAEFFVENALRNGLLALDLPLPALREVTAAAEHVDGAEPFTVDLQACEISGPAGLRIPFAIDPGARIALLEGLDDVGLTLRHLDLIEAWEQGRAPPP